MTIVKKKTRTMAAKLLDTMCANMQIIKCFEDSDVDEVAISLQELLDDEDAAGITEATTKLVAHANELRVKAMARIRAKHAYYAKNNELHEMWKSAKALAIKMRGTAGEIDALRAWLEIDVEWNNMKRVDHNEEENWSDVMNKAWHALAEDAGLHLSIPQDGVE